jgi:hypothetical protein
MLVVQNTKKRTKSLSPKHNSFGIPFIKRLVTPNLKVDLNPLHSVVAFIQ